MLEKAKVVDLTIPLDSNVIMWPGTPKPEAETIVTVAHDGFYARKVSFFEHSGTHFDAPCHFVENGKSVDKIPVKDLVVPAVVIDISDRIAGDPDGVLLLEDVQQFEARHGKIAKGIAVLLRTGWEEFNGNREKYAGKEGELRFPGFGIEAATYLVNECEPVGLGIDTLGVDPGVAADFPVHLNVSHPKGLWHLENLQNLKQLPATGAWLVIGVLPLVDGSGSPARVIALLP
jgi:kynurenine formamidase